MTIEFKNNGDGFDLLATIAASDPDKVIRVPLVNKSVNLTVTILSAINITIQTSLVAPEFAISTDWTNLLTNQSANFTATIPDTELVRGLRFVVNSGTGSFRVAGLISGGGTFIGGGGGGGPPTVVAFDSKTLGYVNLADYVTDFTGATAQDTEVANAIAAATSNKKALLHPGGTILLTSTLVNPMPTISFNPSYNDPNKGRAVFKFNISGATSTTRYYDIPTTPYGGFLENICILGSSTNNPNTAIQGVGLSAGRYGSTPDTATAVRRGWFRNVRVEGFSTGFDMQGWGLALNNIWIIACGLGAKFESCNANDMDMNFENCQQDFIWKGGAGNSFRRLQMEGIYGNASSKIDDCDSFNIGALYCEQVTLARTVPWLTFGETTLCNNVTVTHGKTTDCGSASPILLDKVDYADINCFYRDNGFSVGLGTTANTKYVQPRYQNIHTGFNNTNDVKKLRHQALNLFPNPTFQGLRNGLSKWEIGGGTRATIAQETVNFRNGAGGLRLTATPSQANSYLIMRIKDAETIQALKGDSATFAAWIYVPDIAIMMTTTIPAIKIVCNNGTSDTVNLLSSNGYFNLNALSLFNIVVPNVPSDTTEIALWFYVNTSATTATAGQYISILEAYLCPGSCAEAIYSGRIGEHPLGLARMHKGKIAIKAPQTFFSTSLEGSQNSLQQWQVGDVVEFTDPDATIRGKECTTAGAGAAAVFTDISYGGAGGVSSYLWTAKPAANTMNGKEIFVVDVGVNGSFWRSNGSKWIPKQNIVLHRLINDFASTNGTAVEAYSVSPLIPAGVLANGLNIECRYKVFTSATGDTTNITINIGTDADGITGASPMSSVVSISTTNRQIGFVQLNRIDTATLLKTGILGGSVTPFNAGVSTNTAFTVPSMATNDLYISLTRTMTTGGIATSTCIFFEVILY